jgi:hypothetical protein
MSKTSLGNLRPMSRELAVVNGKKGGMKSGEVRRNKKNIKELILLIFKLKVPIDAINDDIKKKYFKSMSNDEAIIYAQLIKAINGDTQAAIFLRDTSGQKPVEKQSIEKRNTIEAVMKKISSDSEY